MTIAIIIPARYGSTRFPGKPLAMIGGKTMLARVVDIAKVVQSDNPSIHLAVATEDNRILQHCNDIGVDCVMTSADCATGSDRVLEAAQKLGSFTHTIGLQGDAPFTPPSSLHALVDVFQKKPETQVATPVVRLRWDELDSLREAKKTLPFSGTTCVTDSNGMALWFSKTILPAIRKEDRTQGFSPVLQHIGLYGFRMDALEKFCSLPQSRYELLEGLEQLRLLEHGIPIQTVTIDLPAGLAQAGIDSPEDLERAEKILVHMDAA